METGKRLEDTLNPAARAVSARALSAATTMAARPGPFRHAEAPAWVAAARAVAAVDLAAAGVDLGVVAARVINRVGHVPWLVKFRNGDTPYAASEVELQRNSLVHFF
jgi:hypothetical protein